jgi:hypothetical protein
MMISHDLDFPSRRCRLCGGRFLGRFPQVLQSLLLGQPCSPSESPRQVQLRPSNRPRQYRDLRRGLFLCVGREAGVRGNSQVVRKGGSPSGVGSWDPEPVERRSRYQARPPLFPAHAAQGGPQ